MNYGDANQVLEDLSEILQDDADVHYLNKYTGGYYVRGTMLNYVLDADTINYLHRNRLEVMFWGHDSDGRPKVSIRDE